MFLFRDVPVRSVVNLWTLMKEDSFHLKTVLSILLVIVSVFWIWLVWLVMMGDFYGDQITKEKLYRIFILRM